MKWTEEEIDILKKYYFKMMARDIQQKYLFNRTIEAIKLKAERIGLRADLSKISSIMNRKYHCNELFFCIPNNINSYWSGFIAADGYVYTGEKNGLKLSINLKKSDYLHLQKMNKNMNGNYLIRIDDNTCYLTISGYNNIINDLKDNFSIVQKKSLILQPPKIYNEDYIRSFIRGYFDGDGCLSKINKFNGWQVNITSGSLDIITWIKNQTENFLMNIKCNIYHYNKYYCLILSTRQALRFLQWLYYNSTQDTRLDRKYNSFLQLQSRCYEIDNKKLYSKYRGVTYDKSRNKWISNLKYKKQYIHVGRFLTEKEAARAYNAKAQEMGLFDRCYEVN